MPPKYPRRIPRRVARNEGTGLGSGGREVLVERPDQLTDFVGTAPPENGSFAKLLDQSAEGAVFALSVSGVVGHRGVGIAQAACEHGDARCNTGAIRGGEEVFQDRQEE